MRILIFSWKDLLHPRMGGAEVFTHQVATSWVRAGHDVTLFTSYIPGAPGHEFVDGVEVIRRGGRYRVYPAARRFYRNEARGKFDLVIDEVNTRPFGAPRFVDDAPVTALIFQVAFEVWRHECQLPVALAGRYLLEPVWLRGYARTRVVTISESSRASLQHYGLRDIRIVPVGVDVSPLASQPPKEPNPTILFVGRLVNNKRPHHALTALSHLRQQLPNAQLWVVGDGSLADRLQKRAPDGVEFFGRVTDSEKLELMARAHALVATSVREGWGMVVSEAAAVGTPAVVYDVPGLRDSATACGGVLVSPQPDALASALAHYLPSWADHPPGRLPVPGWDEVAQQLLGHAVDTAVPAPTGRTS